MLVQGFHYPFPSVAYVEKSGAGYREIAVPWKSGDLIRPESDVPLGCHSGAPQRRQVYAACVKLGRVRRARNP